MRTSAGALVQAHEHQARECGRGLGLLHGVFDDPINKLSDLPWAALVNGLGLLYARAPARERMHITRVRQRPQRRTLVAVQQCSSGMCRPLRRRHQSPRTRSPPILETCISSFDHLVRSFVQCVFDPSGPEQVERWTRQLCDPTRSHGGLPFSGVCVRARTCVQLAVGRWLGNLRGIGWVK